MFDRNIYEKLRNEEPLSAKEAARVDEMLEAGADIARLVEALPEEPLSMTWRSQLNERVAEAARRTQRRARVFALWRPALGLGVAGVLAIMFTFKEKPIAPSEGPSVEAGLLQTYRQSVSGVEIAGAGLSQSEAVATRNVVDDFNWNEADVETL